MKITAQQLQEITSVLCRHFEDSGCGEIDLRELSYWTVSGDSEYDVNNTPAQFTLGDLEEDWSELQKISVGSSDPVGYGFVWLAAVLRAVGKNANC